MKNSAVIVLFVSLVLTLHKCNGAVKECYQCTVSCNNPSLQQCPYMLGDYSCYSMTISQPPDGKIEYTKGCTITDDPAMATVCNAMNNRENSSCYICDYDLCNEENS